MNDRLGRALKSASDVDKVWIPLNLHGWVNLLETIVHRYLTPELESRVKAKITSGMHNNASEVVREALRFVSFPSSAQLANGKLTLRR